VFQPLRGHHDGQLGILPRLANSSPDFLPQHGRRS
jgi:hypothetical protein